jgi:hypothetical protein
MQEIPAVESIEQSASDRSRACFDEIERGGERQSRSRGGDRFGSAREQRMSRSESRLRDDVTFAVDDDALLGEIEQHGRCGEMIGIGRVAMHDERAAFRIEQQQQQVFGDQHGVPPLGHASRCASGRGEPPLTKRDYRR